MALFRRILFSIALLSAVASAAPLFPDVPDNHWAKDAVAALAAKGLVEGYPDGTFKGDRAASRWETAMIVARLLAKMEQAHSTFATKSELEELRKLTTALREELDALGVRVDNLEESVGRIDQRVTELERITFYGSIEARVSFQSYSNNGANESDPTNPIINFNNAVGSATGAGGRFVAGPAAGQNFDPFALGTFTVNNLKTGRPIGNGTGFTAKAILGMNIKVSPDVDAGAEFAAFVSQGNALTDLYYGASAPYLSNAFTAISTVTGGLAGVQSANHQPFTRMTLDHFWVHHKPTNTRLRVGAFNDIHFDELVYQKQYNPGAFGPKFLDSYGFQVWGDVPLDEKENTSLTWELMGTLLPDRNGGVGGAAYFNHAYGANLAYNFDRRKGRVKFNFLRAANDASGGAARQVGLITGANNNPIPWVNPPGQFFNQVNPATGANAGLGSLTDTRPIPSPALGNDGVTGVAGQANFGNLGPQDQNSYGVSARYLWDGDYAPRIKLEYASSDYAPNQNSGYTVDGDAFRVSAGATFFGNTEVDLEYLAVDPTYDPFVLQIPRVGGILFNGLRLGENFFNYRGDLYSLHDTEVFPHNREGFRGKVKWDFNENGAVLVKFGFLDQKKASLQDVRFSANSLGAGVPNTPVLGFSPGFVEPVFGGFSPFTFAASGGNALAVPLEAPKGDSDFFSITGQHEWLLDENQERGITVTAHLNSTNYSRNSNLRSLLAGVNGIAGESVNNVDLTYTGWELGVDYDVTTDFTAKVGYGEFRLSGHYDPYGVYSAYAISVNNTGFKNLDVVQTQPFVGFDYSISDSTSWDVMATFLSTKDKISPTVFGNPTTPGNNTVFGTQTSLHPFSYDGIMVNSSFNLSF